MKLNNIEIKELVSRFYPNLEAEAKRAMMSH